MHRLPAFLPEAFAEERFSRAFHVCFSRFRRRSERHSVEAAPLSMRTGWACGRFGRPVESGSGGFLVNVHSSDVGRRTPSAFVTFFSGRFSLLFVSLILAFALCPFFEGYVRLTLLTDIYLTVILLASIQVATSDKRSFAIALVLAAPYLLLKWGSEITASRLPWHFEEIFAVLFVAYVLTLIFAYIARQQRVTRDVIMAAVCGYFLLGLAWAFVYFFVESALPGSFQFSPNTSAAKADFLYYSFVTMTTVGYGDMLPVSNAARSLAILEAVMGQLYLAVTIARLVGIQSSQAQSGGDE
jgi:hypothetical protein